ncbi:MAG: ECF transporter S component [Clostridia bacterium]|nr:ECF transporter S component [Clostridia bacterium]
MLEDKTKGANTAAVEAGKSEADERILAAERLRARQEADEKKRRLIRRIVSTVLILVFVPSVVLVGLLEWQDRKYYIVSILIIIFSMAPFFLVFEKRRPRARELTLIAVMVALGVAGRAAFYMLPQFKPIAAIVIITGVSLGSEAGFITGALTAFVSNIFFGQGPWTPWQMFALGLIGFLSGILFNDQIKTKWNLFLLCVFGAFATVGIYGQIMDTQFVFASAQKVTWDMFLAAYASGLPMNLIFAAATVFFLLVLTKPLLNKLGRIKKKHGVFE